MIIIGIDPGLSGAIAFLNQDLSLIDVVNMPVMAYTKKRQQVNAAELTKILIRRPPGKSMLCLEQVSSMPGQGVAGMFSFGMSYGIAIGVVAALQIPTLLVTPQLWKKRAGLIGKEKDTARALAQQLYPEANLGSKKDIGKADAILIARFGST